MEADDLRTGDWPGVIDPEILKSEVVEDSNRLADAAKVGDWNAVLCLLESSLWLGPNQWRIGGTSWFTPLHQAAWHGAPAEVADRLVSLGSWRSLRDASGNRPIDIATKRRHDHLMASLASADVAAHDRRRYDAWDRHLDALIAERTAELEPVRFRSVPTEVAEIEQLESLWFPYPGMYGGFSISAFKARLLVESWCRVSGGSGQAHVITEHGCVLVEAGFV